MQPSTTVDSLVEVAVIGCSSARGLVRSDVARLADFSARRMSTPSETGNHTPFGPHALWWPICHTTCTTAIDAASRKSGSQFPVACLRFFSSRIVMHALISSLRSADLFCLTSCLGCLSSSNSTALLPTAYAALV